MAGCANSAAGGSGPVEDDASIANDAPGPIFDARIGTSPEACDGLDNDLDGVVDNGCPCSPGEVRDCFTGAASQRLVGACTDGTMTCFGDALGELGSFGPCTGDQRPEPDDSCDAIDQDCDGMVDEELIAVCGSSVGNCETGTSLCMLGQWLPCAGMVEETDELCNGLDDDCDGDIDEDLVQSCGTDVGVCEAGTQTCSAGTWGSCEDSIEPVTELCNGLDDNCDNSVDEGVLPNCGVDAVGSCHVPTQACSVDLENTASTRLWVPDSAHGGNLDLTGSFTIELWVKRTTTAISGRMGLVTKDAATDAAYSFYLVGDNSPKVKISQNGSMTTEIWWPNSHVPADVWVHLALVCNIDLPDGTGRFRVYVNGIDQGTATSTYVAEPGIATLNNSGADLAVGEFIGANYFDGHLDEVRIWKDVRTAVEINNNYLIDLPNPQGEPDLAAYWPLNNSLADLGPNDIPLLNSGTVFESDLPY